MIISVSKSSPTSSQHTIIECSETQRISLYEQDGNTKWIIEETTEGSLLLTIFSYCSRAVSWAALRIVYATFVDPNGQLFAQTVPLLDTRESIARAGFTESILNVSSSVSEGAWHVLRLGI